VISRLQAEFGETYNFQNVLLSATHTHSGPAGFLQYVLFSVSSLGFVEQTLQAMVAGIVEVGRLLYRETI
jgi:neutral ceramidase